MVRTRVGRVRGVPLALGALRPLPAEEEDAPSTLLARSGRRGLVLRVLGAMLVF